MTTEWVSLFTVFLKATSGKISYLTFGTKQQQKFHNNFTTSPEVNRGGQNKVFCDWRVSEKYKEPGQHKHLYTKSHSHERRTFYSILQYFNYRNGSPQTLVLHLLKEAVAVIYDNYFMNNMDPNVVASCKTFTGDNSDHVEDKPVDADFKLMIPQWFMQATYPAGCLVPCVSIVLLS